MSEKTPHELTVIMVVLCFLAPVIVGIDIALYDILHILRAMK